MRHTGVPRARGMHGRLLPGAVGHLRAACSCTPTAPPWCPCSRMCGGVVVAWCAAAAVPAVSALPQPCGLLLAAQSSQGARSPVLTSAKSFAYSALALT